MLVKVVNFNSKVTKQQLENEEKTDKFWVMLYQGAIESNYVIVEISSYNDIDIDVEFYGYQTSELELWRLHGARFFHQSREFCGIVPNQVFQVAHEFVDKSKNYWMNYLLLIDRHYSHLLPCTLLIMSPS